ncbi:MAG: copper(I)-binding protein [Paraglaciecola sp.]|jgi:copper(I)-binding protein
MTRLSLLLLLVISSVAHSELRITEASVRLLPPSLPNTSAYFKVENTGNQDRILIGASSPIADLAELHNHIMLNDMMRMEKQDTITIGAGQTLVFAPGGLHMMIFSLKSPLQNGQNVRLALHTKDGAIHSFSAKVGEPTQSTHHH